ncbi:aminomethyl-transferring glycine dehydrogenase subunit GcvPB, partial [Bacillus spizizenii]|nr:aminomethyl-transferring glycine dehydrogenase subunit GcvPB [Bacillus spizizenii]
SKETLDAFIHAMIQIAWDAEDNPELVQAAPHTTIVKRMDETKAARHPVLRYETEER